MLDALIFEVDGTLADTDELHRRAFNETFAEAGLDWHWTRAAYHDLLRTTGGTERIARFFAETGRRAPMPIADLHAAKTARYVALMAAGQIALRPGIADLVAEARAAGLRLGLATTTSAPNVEALCLATFGKPARQVFDALACGDMVAAGKPAPDVYLLALKHLNIAPQAAIALENSRNGLLSARAAGPRCCVSPGAYALTEDFTGADLVTDEFTDLGGLSGLRALLEDP